MHNSTWPGWAWGFEKVGSLRMYVWMGFLLVMLCGGQAVAQSDEDCMECHADEELVREGDWRPGTSVFVDPDVLANSMHEGMECLDCHVDATEDHDERLPALACADCHDDAAEDYDGGLHGQALNAGNELAPDCAACHGGHEIQTVDDETSPVHRANLLLTCAECHADSSFIQRARLHRVSPLEGYQQSVHFGALAEEGATCTDCHGAHGLYKPSDPRSAIHQMNISSTCGQCHEDIQQVYEVSVHGQAVADGQSDAPSCIDCHGEHEIRSHLDPKSSVYPAQLAKTTCVWCHESERITRRFGLPSHRQESYADSYHGLADQAGSTTVANCASCHGIHDILPSTDPASLIHADNLPATCGECHPGAGANFAAGKIHAGSGDSAEDHPFVSMARTLYLWLIVIVIGGMVVHNGLDMRLKGRVARPPRGRYHERFTVNERLQHAVMAGSFIVLAYTGFALKFPNAWWAVPLVWLNGGEETRRIIHRGAAIAMVAVCVYHLIYLVATVRGRDQLNAMRPKLQDARDMAQMIGYYFGRRPHGPAFDRFGYIEKLEYWALVWGSIVMTLTGFGLWFENQTLMWIPKWGLDLFTVVHYYEAWLATLAIIVWHFYWVMFNPSVYPMSLVWLDGHMSEEEMRHEHPRELERLREQPEDGKESKDDS
ncbi:MAG: DUF4405 domain-containing protein [Gemmatimonadetes bacterium]|nr:DUF4405 domain-containing protein [Gemmatimonadota bacterium]MBT6147398.1 DUF4405 domain-containing protein [Gemmatimonadota bacterium]MBT7864629.1 DUF4405 domain-containing protein [Gemmatimonadota bacterium]